jgi:hypothetical protein
MSETHPDIAANDGPRGAVKAFIIHLERATDRQPQVQELIRELPIETEIVTRSTDARSTRKRSTAFIEGRRIALAIRLHLAPTKSPAFFHTAKPGRQLSISDWMPVSCWKTMWN